ncbi:DNA polymerase III subunit alpha [Chitinibacter tainanensis]|uniref:DNA polymerase III subunit alpha n=1 Tax=Chitinibacter tainanensis TaxID=230667 RepID=UPI00041536F7|nr:DNA polymerase III subunit alpha [Chitinibacter tainanensis]
MKVALGVRSDFTIGGSLLSVKKAVAQAVEKGLTAIAITDKMTVSGMPALMTAAKDAGIKPIIGVTVEVVLCDPTEKSAEVKRPRSFTLRLLVRNESGLKAIFKLLSLANSESHFYYFPRLSFDEVLEHIASAPDGLVVMTGDLLGALYKVDQATAYERLDKLRAAQPHALFIELPVVNNPLFARIGRDVLGYAHATGIPVVATRPALLADPSQSNSLDVYAAVCSNNKMKDGWRIAPSQISGNLSILSPAEFAAECKAFGETYLKLFDEALDMERLKGAIRNMAVVESMCDYTWSKWPVSLPKLVEKEELALVELCKRAFVERLVEGSSFGYKPSKADLPHYMERLKYELGVLSKLGFCGYFLLARYITRWAKQNGVAVGPGRGSVGGSLVAFLLGITDVDPIRHGLIFERFINPERLDLPDADLDFQATRRELVINHITEKFGADYVAGISNFTTLAGASAIRDVGRVFEVPNGDLECTKLYPKEHGMVAPMAEAAEQVGAIKTYSERYPELWQHSLALEDHNRSLGRHAAGIVIAGVPINERAVVEMRSGQPTTNWDKRTVEDMGLVKMDILGLTTLDLTSLVLDYIKERHGKTPDLLDLPLDDTITLEGFGQGKTIGVFQFESGGMMKLLKDLASYEALTFEDIAAATALYRPGPLDSGLLDQFVARKQGLEPVSYPHPLCEDALKDTYGVIVYQEEVMQVARDLCGFTMAGADGLRKAIGKKDMDKMAKIGASFISGAELGQIEVTLDDGRTLTVHRATRYKAVDSDELLTVEEAIARGVELAL